MWIMTTRGFFSAVEKPGDRERGTVTVRARSIEHLENLIELLPEGTRIITNEGGDYPARVRVSTAAWTHCMARLALEIDYPNFKDAVKARQGRKVADAYMSCWSALLRLEGKREHKNRGWTPLPGVVDSSGEDDLDADWRRGKRGRGRGR